jgi:thioredoxin reductase (NADPH)
MADEPVLTAAQIDRIRPFSVPRIVKKGEILFEPADKDIRFFVVISGCIAITQPEDDREQIVAERKPGQFTGEMTMLSGRRSLLRGRVAEDGEVLAVTAENLKGLITKDAELGEIIMAAFVLRRLELIDRGKGNVVLLGSNHSANTLELREFLTRNGHPFAYLDLDTDPSSQALLDRFNVQMGDVPMVICNNRNVLRNPSIHALTECLELNGAIDLSKTRDVIIIGAGPAGLAAAVYAASEGLDVLIIEKGAPGGQASSSSKIENYLGFPNGLSGQELANLALAQTTKFGARIMVAETAVYLDCGRSPYRLVLHDGKKLSARTIVLASGAQYARLPLENIDAFAGRGIYYNATHMEGQLCNQEEVIVVGGGNSAGQAAVFLSRNSSRVHMLVRSGKLADTMSNYLIERIEENPKIDVHYRTEITELKGNGHLDSVVWRNGATGESACHPIRHAFIMAGASPRTEWLEGCIALDKRGFIFTGPDVVPMQAEFPWPLKRSPFMLETSLPGVFAVGDARSGSVKRVASAVGEGSIAVHFVHQVLAEMALSAG